MSENYLSFQQREKCFLLTSPFIEPGRCDAMKGVPISGRLLQLRCATCNKVQEPSSRKAMELFAAGHWFHAGYTLLIKIVEPGELASTIDIQTSMGPLNLMGHW